MMEDWIDAVCDVFGQVNIGKFGQMNSPHLISKDEFPASISPKDDFPIALSIPASVDLIYAAGGIKEGRFTGTTEMHLTPDLNKSHLPAIIPFFGRIWTICAANFQLGGLVEQFVITRIQGPLALKWGDEAEHWGLLVDWMVDEHVAGTVVVTRS